MEKTVFTIFHRTGAMDSGFEAEFVPYICYGAAAEGTEQTDTGHSAAGRLTIWINGGCLLMDRTGARLDPQRAGISPGDRIMTGEHTVLDKAESYGIHTVVPSVRGSHGANGLRIVAG